MCAELPKVASCARGRSAKGSVTERDGGIMATLSTAPEADPRTRRREQRGWYFYDWANSAFSTTVVAVFLGPYLSALTESAAGVGGFVYLLGIPVRAGSFF